MSNFNSNNPGTFRKDTKPTPKLGSFFGKAGGKTQTEYGGPGSIRKPNGQPKAPDLMPQGKALSVGTKGKPPVVGNKFDIAKLAANENDERYQYLLKRAIIRRVEDEDKLIYAELPGLPGVLVVYRKPSERNSNPERLNLDRRELTQMPLLEGEERLRLLNFQHNFITKVENMPHLDAARRKLFFLRYFRKSFSIMHVFCCCIKARSRFKNRGKVTVKIDIPRRAHFNKVTVQKYF